MSVEVVVASSLSDQLFSSRVWDAKAGSVISTFKNGGVIASKCLKIINKTYLISADANKPLLHVWPLNSQEPASDLNMVMNGLVTALDLSPNGLYCVAGISNKLYIWQVQTGHLLNVFTKHYQNITNIKFIDNDHFISCGEDGLVMVWKLVDLIEFNLRSFQDFNLIEPFYKLLDHSSAVTDIHISGNNMKSRLYTVSSDQTCKIYSLHSGKMILSIVFLHKLTAVAVNKVETLLYVGTESGVILQIPISPMPRRLEHHILEENISQTFKLHQKRVTCLSLSLDGISLLSGSDDETIVIWDIPTAQSSRIFNMKGPVTNAFFDIPPMNMTNEKFENNVIIKKFQRSTNLEPFEKALLPRTGDKYFGEKNNLMTHKGEEKSDEAIVEKLKTINKQLYTFTMEKILDNPVAYAKRGIEASNTNATPTQNGNSHESVNGSRRKKRRTGYPHLNV